MKRKAHFIEALLVVSFLAIVPAHAQLETRPTPMWEGIEKTEADIRNDEDLVKKALELTDGDRRAATVQMLLLGWDQIGQGQPDNAIRSFNQAWLLEPDFADVHWGFAVATHIRGDDLAKVERHFERAVVGNENNPRLETDHGRVLGERGMTEKARERFEAALSISPEYAPAHLGMIRVAQDLGDRKLEVKHQILYDTLSNRKDK